MTAKVPTTPTEPPRSRSDLKRLTQEALRSVGFDEVGVASVAPGVGLENLERWTTEGRHGDMAYMADRREARRDPNRVLAGVRSVVVAALQYKSAEPSPTNGEARVSRYAWGADYHDVVREKLQRAIERLKEFAPDERFRAVVDSAPFMERDYARLAGLGWFGKNTLLLNRRLGSFFFLGAILTTADLEADAPFETDHCGSCTKCLDACPTQAFDGPYELDPRRCISYLTIEHRGPIPETRAPRMDDWAFGCDVCQDVCPWNRKAPTGSTAEFQPAPDLDPLPLATVLSMSEAEFRSRFRGTPLFRAKRPRLIRNALIVAVNRRRRELRNLIELLTRDADDLVRTTAEWALARLAE